MKAMGEAMMQGAAGMPEGKPYVTGDVELSRRLCEIGVEATPRMVRAWRCGNRIPCGTVRGKHIYRWSEVLRTVEGWTEGGRRTAGGVSSGRVRVL